MIYQRKILSTGALVGAAGPLPAELVGLADESLADLSWADPALGYGGHGFDPVPEPEPEPARVYTPPLPMFKARKVLIKHGLMPAVEAALAAMPGEAGALARVDWEYAPNLIPNSPLVANLANAIGLTSEQIDALVLEAATLP